MKTLFLLLLAALAHVTAFAGGGSKPENPKSLVLHEWGTFTSVQGADGVQIKWNPFTVSELPKFVYSLNNPGIKSDLAISYLLGKPNLLALQRMETPVIYLYSDKDVSVDLTVGFPEGTITEWYPQATEIGRFTRGADNKVGNHLTWKDCQVLASQAMEDLAELLPRDPSGSHYYAARNTSASLLKVKTPDQQTEHEKFLFYRGVGNFIAPLTTSLPAPGAIRLENSGAEALNHLFIYEVRHGMGQFTYLEQLDPAAHHLQSLPTPETFIPLSQLQEKLAAQMQKSLEQEGLFADEARSMIDTWKDSWFGEDGLRVLYTLPREWTDQRLPLALQPEPSKVVRVMVGRAEMITPEIETHLLQEILRFNTADKLVQAQALSAAAKLQLGRFAEPTVRRLISQNPGKEFNQLAWGFLDALNKTRRETNLASTN